LNFFFPAAGLREREERAARKAKKKAEKARQTEAEKAQQTEAAAVQAQVVPPVTQNSHFYPQLHSSESTAATLFLGPDFTNVMHSSPAVPASNLTLPPHNGGGWNQNQYVGPQSSPTSNNIQPWTQNLHHAPQSSSLSTVPVSNLPENQNLTGNVTNVIDCFNFLGKLISGIGRSDFESTSFL
jgi:hypothetical protein